MMTPEDRIKLFAMANTLVERELDGVEQRLQLNLERSTVDDKDETYYPQFESALRQEAATMSAHYELFYCLENSIRQLISETLKAQFGEQWWALKVPQQVRDNVEKNVQRERDSGVTLRSDSNIDYTTFGELGDIVRGSWSSFDSMFSSERAFTRIMTSLNQLRGPIAHCCPLGDDEVIRLQLAVRDWFRLME